MMPQKKKGELMNSNNHNNAIKKAENFTLEHPDMKSLVHSLIKMSRHPKAMCKIQIGRYNVSEGIFATKLTSNIRFATVHFSPIENDIQICIRNHTENICVFNLAAIKLYHYEKKNYHFIRKEIYEIETFYLHYNEDDYMFKVTFEPYNQITIKADKGLDDNFEEDAE